MRRFDRGLGRYTLDSLRIHVGNDVLRHHLSGLAIGPGIARQPPERWYVAKRPQHRIGVPYLVLLPILGGPVDRRRRRSRIWPAETGPTKHHNPGHRRLPPRRPIA